MRSPVRNDFLVDADRRTFCWEFLSDLMAEMAGQGTVQDAAKMDRNSRYPTAGAMFKQVEVTPLNVERLKHRLCDVYVLAL